MFRRRDEMVEASAHDTCKHVFSQVLFQLQWLSASSERAHVEANTVVCF